MFHLDDTEIETSLSQLQQSWLTTLLCGGIINPFGPTLTAVLFYPRDQLCSGPAFFGPLDFLPLPNVSPGSRSELILFPRTS